MALPATLLASGISLHPIPVLDSGLEASTPNTVRRDAWRRGDGLAAHSSRAVAAVGALKTAAELQSALEYQNAERILALGIPALDAALPRGGLARGSVIELQVQGSSGAATSFALCACRAAQRAGEQWHGQRPSSEQQSGPLQGSPALLNQLQGNQLQGSRAHNNQRSNSQQGHAGMSPRPWCAFIDPSASLFAPGVARLGVDLSRLLVVRPAPEAVERVAVRIAEAKAVSLLVIDLRGPLDGRGLGEHAVSSQRWQRTVRRLALAVKQLSTTVILLTSAERRQALPLPVAMRLEFTRASVDMFELRVGKERSGRVSSARAIPWSVFETFQPENEPRSPENEPLHPANDSHQNTSKQFGRAGDSFQQARELHGARESIQPANDSSFPARALSGALPRPNSRSPNSRSANSKSGISKGDVSKISKSDAAKHDVVAANARVGRAVEQHSPQGAQRGSASSCAEHHQLH